MSTAFVVIDAQMVMFTPPYVVHRAEESIANICSLLDKARAAGVPVFFVQHQEQPGQEMAEGTPAWQLHPALAPRPEELVVPKRTPDSFHGTVLHEELQKRGISKLVVAGYQTEFCVDTSLRRAFSLGYEVTLAADAHSTFDSAVLKGEQIVAHHNKVLGDCFAQLKNSSDIEFSGIEINV